MIRKGLILLFLLKRRVLQWLIVVLSNGRFEWVIKYDPSNLEDKEFLPFKLDKSYMYDEEKIISIMYNQSFTKIYAGTEWGCILTFPQ